MQTILQDIRYAFRSLLRQPGFTLVAVIALGLGIGATTAIFTLVNSVLLRPLPFEKPEQLLAIGQTYPKNRNALSSASYRNFADWQDQNRSCEQMAAYDSNTFTLTGEGSPQRLEGAVVTNAFFPLLHVRPILGRVFEPADDQAGGGKDGLPIILSWQFWQKNFGGDQQILGRRLQLSGNTYTVVGVMPAGFSWPLGAKPMDVWTSLAVDAQMTSENGIMKARGYCVWNVLARLKPDVTLEQARADLDSIAAGLAKQYPENNEKVGIAVKPMLEQMTGNLRPSLQVLFGAVLCVLLIACTNVANLLTVKATGRRREIAVRAALGASRWRIIRQLLTESVLLSAIGGLFGLLIAVWGAEGLRMIAPEGIPRLNETGVDWRVLLFMVGVSAFTGILFGLIPALQSASPDLHTVFKESAGTATEGKGKQRIRGLLVVAELALSLLLLTGAGLLLQSFIRLQRVDPGFNPRDLLTFAVDLSGERFDKPAPVVAFFNSLQEQLKSLPGVTAVSLTSFLPLSGNNPNTGFEINGRPNEPGKVPMAAVRIISADYFRTMGIAVKQGREFTGRDTLSTPSVIVINQAFAKKYFPNENALGQQLKPGFATYGIEPRNYEIVGVVGDIRHDSLRQEPQPEFYFASAQMPFNYMTVVVRGDVKASSLIPAATEMVGALDKNTPILDVKTLDDYIASSLTNSRMYMTLLALFASLAVLLAVIGLYGLISYSVAQRKQEIGIRIALGASRTDILRLIVGQGLRTILAGIAVGLFASTLATRVLQNLLFGVTATDLATFSGVALLLMGVALLACYLPARRAAEVDPMIALRTE